MMEEECTPVEECHPIVECASQLIDYLASNQSTKLDDVPGCRQILEPVLGFLDNGSAAATKRILQMFGYMMKSHPEVFLDGINFDDPAPSVSCFLKIVNLIANAHLSSTLFEEAVTCATSLVQMYCEKTVLRVLTALFIDLLDALQKSASGFQTLVSERNNNNKTTTGKSSSTPLLSFNGLHRTLAALAIARPADAESPCIHFELSSLSEVVRLHRALCIFLDRILRECAVFVVDMCPISVFVAVANQMLSLSPAIRESSSFLVCSFLESASLSGKSESKFFDIALSAASLSSSWREASFATSLARIFYLLRERMVPEDLVIHCRNLKLLSRAHFGQKNHKSIELQRIFLCLLGDIVTAYPHALTIGAEILPLIGRREMEEDLISFFSRVMSSLVSINVPMSSHHGYHTSNGNNNGNNNNNNNIMPFFSNNATSTINLLASASNPSQSILMTAGGAGGGGGGLFTNGFNMGFFGVGNNNNSGSGSNGGGANLSDTPLGKRRFADASSTGGGGGGGLERRLTPSKRMRLSQMTQITSLDMSFSRPKSAIALLLDDIYHSCFGNNNNSKSSEDDDSSAPSSSDGEVKKNKAAAAAAKAKKDKKEQNDEDGVKTIQTIQNIIFFLRLARMVPNEVSNFASLQTTITDLASREKDMANLQFFQLLHQAAGLLISCLRHPLVSGPANAALCGRVEKEFFSLTHHTSRSIQSCPSSVVSHMLATIRCVSLSWPASQLLLFPRKALAHPDPEIRSEACWTLAVTSSESTASSILSIITEHASKEESAKVHICAALAVGRALCGTVIHGEKERGHHSNNGVVAPGAGGVGEAAAAALTLMLDEGKPAAATTTTGDNGSNAGSNSSSGSNCRSLHLSGGMYFDEWSDENLFRVNRRCRICLLEEERIAHGDVVAPYCNASTDSYRLIDEKALLPLFSIFISSAKTEEVLYAFLQSVPSIFRHVRFMEDSSRRSIAAELVPFATHHNPMVRDAMQSVFCAMVLPPPLLAASITSCTSPVPSPNKGGAAAAAAAINNNNNDTCSVIDALTLHEAFDVFFSETSDDEIVIALSQIVTAVAAVLPHSSEFVPVTLKRLIGLLTVKPKNVVSAAYRALLNLARKKQMTVPKLLLEHRNALFAYLLSPFRMEKLEALSTAMDDEPKRILAEATKVALWRMVLQGDAVRIKEVASMLGVSISDLVEENIEAIISSIWLRGSEIDDKAFQGASNFLQKLTGKTTNELMTGRKLVWPILWELGEEYASREVVLKRLEIVLMDSNADTITPSKKIRKVEDRLADTLSETMDTIVAHCSGDTVQIRHSLRVLSHYIDIIGPRVKIHVPKIMSTIGEFSQHSQIASEVLDVWELFILRLGTGKEMRPHFSTIVVSILAFLETQPQKVAQILSYLLVECRASLQSCFATIPFLPDHPLLQNVRRIFEEEAKEEGMKSALERRVSYLTHGDPRVKLLTVQEIRRLLRIPLNKKQFWMLALSSPPAPIISSLMTNLVSCCAGPPALYFETSYLLGEIGAIDPAKLNMVTREKLIPPPSDEELGRELLIKYLARGVRSGGPSHHGMQGLLFAIQELLIALGCRQTVEEMKRKEREKEFGGGGGGGGGGFPYSFSQGVTMSQVAPADKGGNDFWKSLNQETMDIIAPCIFSKYQLTSQRTESCPIYHPKIKFETWLYKWSLYLSQNQTDSKRSRILTACRTVLRNNREVSLFLLPHLILNVICFGSEEVQEDVKNEVLTILSAIPSSYTMSNPAFHHISAALGTSSSLYSHLQRSNVTIATNQTQVVGNSSLTAGGAAAAGANSSETIAPSTSKNLELELQNGRTNESSLPAGGGGAAATPPHPPPAEHIMQAMFSCVDTLTRWMESLRRSKEPEHVSMCKCIDNFLSIIPKKCLVAASLECRAYTRALLYQEMNIRQFALEKYELWTEQPELSKRYPMQEIKVLETIYSLLDETDGLKGLVNVICDDTSLGQRIIHFENDGDWNGALSCYTQMLRSSTTENTSLLTSATTSIFPTDSTTPRGAAAAAAASASVAITSSNSVALTTSGSGGEASNAAIIRDNDPGAQPSSIVALSAHLGIIRCLHNLSHYELILAYAPSLPPTLSRQFSLQAAWRLSRWDTVDAVFEDKSGSGTGWDLESCVAAALFRLSRGEKEQVTSHLQQARSLLFPSLSATSSESYPRSLPLVAGLHLLTEIQMAADILPLTRGMDGNWSSGSISKLKKLESQYLIRMKLLPPSITLTEMILAARRVIYQSFGMTNSVAQAWIMSSKVMSASGHRQSSIAAALHASNLGLPKATLQRAKLLWLFGERENALATANALLKSWEEPAASDKNSQKLWCKIMSHYWSWMNETKRLPAKEIVEKFQVVKTKYENFEGGFFFLARFLDSMFESHLENAQQAETAAVQTHSSERYMEAEKQKASALQLLPEILLNYSESLRLSRKHLPTSLPRMATLWVKHARLEKQAKFSSSATASSSRSSSTSQPPPHVVQADSVKKLRGFMHDMIDKETLPPPLFFSILPQLASRVCYPDPEVANDIHLLIAKICCYLPHQSMWVIASVRNSNRKLRREAGAKITQMIFELNKSSKGVPEHWSQFDNLASELVRLCSAGMDSKDRKQNIIQLGKALMRMNNLNIVVPTHAALTSASASAKKNENELQHPTIASFSGEGYVMHSAQRPVRIRLRDSEGNEPMFLCKPKDDLRKDCRLMEVNTAINRVLQGSKVGRRKLHVRTYAVIVLNEAYGMVEWVPNTTTLKSVLDDLYRYDRDLPPKIMEWHKQLGTKKGGLVRWYKKVLSMHRPILHKWLANSFPDPASWFDARTAFSRTAAVWSIVGYFVGLGDRHAENVLLDVSNGDCLHVDLSMLFNAGESLKVPEKVPFRLTPNMEDAFGVCDSQGVFRESCVTILTALRQERDMLMTIMDSFLHDPLVEWQSGRDSATAEGKEIPNPGAVMHWQRIEQRIKGIEDGQQLSPEGQADAIIAQANSVERLSEMYIWWMPWY